MDKCGLGIVFISLIFFTVAENVFQSRETERKEVSKLFLNHGIMKNYTILRGLPGGSDSKESAYNAGDPGLIAGSRRSPEEGRGYPLQYCGLEHSMDYSMGSQRVRHDWVTFTLSHMYLLFFKLFSYIAYYKGLSIVPCAI